MAAANGPGGGGHVVGPDGADQIEQAIDARSSRSGPGQVRMPPAMIGSPQ